MPVAREAIVRVVAPQHADQPRVLHRHGRVHPAPQLRPDLVELPGEPPPLRPPLHHKPSIPSPPTVVREPQEGERLRPPLAAPSLSLGRQSTELDQARLALVERQPVLRQPLAGLPGSASGPGRSRASSPQADPFPPPASSLSAASSVLWASPTPDLGSVCRSGRPLRHTPVGDHPDGPGRVSGPDAGLSCVRRPRPRWSVAVLPRDGAHAAFSHGNGLGLHDLHPFGADCPHPTRPLSTLRTPRRRDARKTRFRPARYGVSRAGLPPACPRQLPGALPIHVEKSSRGSERGRETRGWLGFRG